MAVTDAQPRGAERPHLEVVRTLDGRRRLRCRACGRRVTVGRDGTEYGHERRAPEGKMLPTGESCPHRPESVEPYADQEVEGS